MAIALTGERLRAYAGFTKLEHTVFSLPLIVAGTVLRLRGWPSAQLAGWMVLAAIGARVMAMGLNRLIDQEIDACNPRTRQRELPRGAMQRWEAWVIVASAGALYVAGAAAIAPICVWLSPIPVALFVAYPYLKRVTSLSHLGLGVAWSVAPVAGWLAASKTLMGVGEVGWLWLFSVCWVAGFDIIYATMDEVFDREAGLHSLPARMGRSRALRVAALLHGAAFVTLVMLWRTQLRSPLALWWLAGIGALFIWQHAIADRRPAFAFFKLNGLIGFLVFGVVLAGR
ncbi:MAG: 4-hydroxybenzoate octaprenyltransferase [Candidatus Omnitrophota bacterium]|nr:4-hydroxybenzoate octaprenyltransferase [Candidatus Omnitrophota bacterium]